MILANPETVETRMPMSSFASSLIEETRRLFPSRCTEQDHLSDELNSAIHEHRHALDEIVKLIRFGQNRDNYHPLMVRAASSQNKVLSLQKTLNRHLAEHGC